MSLGNDREFIDFLQDEERRRLITSEAARERYRKFFQDRKRKEQAMKCPLSSYVKIVARGDTDIAFQDCLKEACARWDDATNCCIDITIGDALEGIMIALQQIQEKMPHAGQFTK